MKKFLLLLAVAMLSVSAFAAKSVHLKSKGQWAEYILSDKLPVSADDYVSMKVTVANPTGGNFQVKVSCEDIPSDDYNSPAYVQFEDNVATCNFQDFLSSKGYTGKITVVNLQACEGADQEIDLLEVIFVKADGTEEVQELGGDAWGGGAYEAEELEVPEPEPSEYIVNDPTGATMGGWGGSMTKEVVDGVLVIDNPSTTANNWEVQRLEQAGHILKTEFDIMGSVEGTTFAAGLQNTDGYKGCGEFGNVDVTTEWQSIKLTTTCTGEGAKRLVISVGDYAGKLSLKNLKVYDAAAVGIANVTAAGDAAAFNLFGQKSNGAGFTIKAGKVYLVK